MNSRNTIGGQNRASPARPPVSMARAARQTISDSPSRGRKLVADPTSRIAMASTSTLNPTNGHGLVELATGTVERRSKQEECEQRDEHPVGVFGIINPGVVKLAEGRPVDPADHAQDEKCDVRTNSSGSFPSAAESFRGPLAVFAKAGKW